MKLFNFCWHKWVWVRNIVYTKGGYENWGLKGMYRCTKCKKEK